MNRSRYVTRQLDKTDRAIIAALTEDGRSTIKDVATKIGMSSPSVRERILKLEDAGAICGYTVLVDPTVFGLGVAAQLRLSALPGELQRLAKMLDDTPEVVEADRVTGEDCFIAKIVVGDAHELQTVVDRFHPYASADTSIILSSVVTRRLPRL